MDEQCRKVVQELEAKVEKLQKILGTIATEPRGVAKVISRSHIMDNQVFYRVLKANGDELCMPSLVKDNIKDNTEVMTVMNAIENIIPRPLQRIIHEHKMNLVAWEQIGGLKSQIELIRNTVELPLKHPEMFEKYGMKPVGGILLFGKPGCGKTLIAKAIAYAVIGAMKVKEGAFLHLKGSDVLNKYVGESEKIVTNIFRASREYMMHNKQRSVIFIDEAEAMLSKRKEERYTVVPAFLSEMDGMYEERPLVILATNVPEQLDPAIMREGRIDMKLEIGRPTAGDFYDIVSIHLKEKLCHSDCTELAKVAATIVFENERLKKTVNGAMAFTISNIAAREAIVRKVADRTAEEGIIPEDISKAVEIMEHTIEG